MRAKLEDNSCPECGAHIWDLRNWLRSDAVFAPAASFAMVYPDEFDVITLGNRAAVWFAQMVAERLIQPTDIWIRV